jgi:hypothetical protein
MGYSLHSTLESSLKRFRSILFWSRLSHSNIEEGFQLNIHSVNMFIFKYFHGNTMNYSRNSYQGKRDINVTVSRESSLSNKTSNHDKDNYFVIRKRSIFLKRIKRFFSSKFACGYKLFFEACMQYYLSSTIIAIIIFLLLETKDLAQQASH